MDKKPQGQGQPMYRTTDKNEKASKAEKVWNALQKDKRRAEASKKSAA